MWWRIIKGIVCAVSLAFIVWGVYGGAVLYVQNARAEVVQWGSFYDNDEAEPVLYDTIPWNVSGAESLKNQINDETTPVYASGLGTIGIEMMSENPDPNFQYYGYNSFVIVYAAFVQDIGSSTTCDTNPVTHGLPASGRVGATNSSTITEFSKTKRWREYVADPSLFQVTAPGCRVVYSLALRTQGISGNAALPTNVYYYVGDIAYKIYGDFTAYPSPEPPPPENAFLLIVEPEQGETTASTTVEVVAEYGIPEEWDFRFGRTAANITDIFIEYSYFFGSNRVTFTDDEIATTPGVHESTIEHVFPDTTGRPGITLSAVLRIEFDDGGFTDYAISEDVFFSVVASTDIDWGWDYGDEDTRDALARAECSITSIQGCFQNALVYLFAPDPQVLSNFSNMWQQIAMLPPMGYVTVTINALSDLNASGSGAFSFPELPFMNEIFTPLKTAIEGVLWVWIGAQFLHRVRDLDL